jgi:hypothetical protein
MAEPMMVRRQSVQEAKAMKAKGDLHEAIKLLLMSNADEMDGTRVDSNILVQEMLKVLQQDPHAALKVKKGDSESAIKKAYHKMALKVSDANTTSHASQLTIFPHAVPSR